MSVIFAMLIDRFLGEPPERLHPVVWIGRYLAYVGKHLPALRPAAAFLGGTGFWLLGAAIFTGAYAWLGHMIGFAPIWAQWFGLGLLLKPLLSLQLLIKEVAGVESALTADLTAGRQRLSRIVSRDTSQLSETEVRESALESLSENLSDSLIAPLFWFALFGLPGAALYRFANTADASWGYRGKWEWAGKWAARCDDVLNYIPSRITALLLLIVPLRHLRRLSQLRSEAGRTPSPNSGWPMAALALAHGIRLGKPGVYVLNPSGHQPQPPHAEACLRHVQWAGWLGALVVAISYVFNLGVWHG